MRWFLRCAVISTEYDLKKCPCEIFLFNNIIKVYSDHTSIVHPIAEAFAIYLIIIIFFFFWLLFTLSFFNAANIRFQCELITVLNWPACTKYPKQNSKKWLYRSKHGGHWSKHLCIHLYADVPWKPVKSWAGDKEDEDEEKESKF